MTRALLLALAFTLAACSDGGDAIGEMPEPPVSVEATQPDTLEVETSAPDRSEMDAILDRHRLPERDGGETEISDGSIALMDSIREAEQQAAAVMARHRIESPNTLFEDAVYSELPPYAEHNGARLVRCSVSSTDGYYNGPCHFLSEPGGGVSLARPDGGDLSPGMSLISLAKTGDTTGEVRGLTTDGISSRWSEAERSTADPACWGNSEFEICANSL